MIIRKSYISYIFQGFKQNRLGTTLKYPVRYIGTLMGYKLDKSLSGPIQGTLCLTYNCNLRCEMCDLPLRHLDFEKNTNKKALTLKDYQKVIDDFAAIGTSGLALSGGEPMLHPDLYEIIKYARKRELVVQMTTNGWFINEETVLKLFEAGLNTISISLDGASAQTHNKIRRNEKSFEKATNAISLIHKLRKIEKNSIKLNISSTLGKNNYREAIQLVELSKNLGADYIGFMPVHAIAPDFDTHDYANLDSTDISELISTVDQLISLKKKDHFIETSFEYLSMFKDFYQNKKLPIPCMAGFTTLIVDCYGEVFPCFSFYEMKKSWGNIEKHNGLKSFWNSGELNIERVKIKTCRECFWNCQVETNLLYKPFI